MASKFRPRIAVSLAIKLDQLIQFDPKDLDKFLRFFAFLNMARAYVHRKALEQSDAVR